MSGIDKKIDKKMMESLTENNKKYDPITKEMADSIFTSNIFLLGNTHGRYAQKIVNRLLDINLDQKPIFPQVFTSVLKEVLPKGFGPQTYFTWPKIREWACKLDRRSNFQKDQKRAKRMRAAADITIQLVFFLDKRIDNPAVLSWHWCPLCWRTVPNSSGKKKCEAHEINTAGYQKAIRLLQKVDLTTYAGKYDKIPLDQKQQVQKMVDMAFNYGWPDGWMMLSFTKRYLQKKQTNINLSDLNACIDVLDPGALELFRTDQIFKGTEFVELNKRALLTRAETWLMLMSTLKKSGGRRPGAGRPKKGM